MREKSEEGADRPLPGRWLPEPHPPDDAPVWQARTARIMDEAGAELRRLKSRSGAEVAWWSVLARWWRPAPALAVAASALLLLLGRPAVVPEPPPGSIPLALVAADGDPATLWGARGIEVDPVLALIAIQEPPDVSGQDVPTTSRQEENR